MGAESFWHSELGDVASSLVLIERNIWGIDREDEVDVRVVRLSPTLQLPVTWDLDVGPVRNIKARQFKPLRCFEWIVGVLELPFAAQVYATG